MVGHRAGDRGLGRWSDRTASAVVAGLTALCVVAVIATAPADHVNSLSIILGIGAVAAGLLVAGETDGLSISASFLVYVLAGAFLGVRSAALIAVITELVASLRLHTRLRAMLLNNLPACVVPAVVGALICRGIAPTPASTPSFYVAVVVAAIAAITLSFVIWATLRRTFFPELEQFGIQTFVEDLPNTLLNVLLVVAGAGITVKLGHAGIAYALAAVFTFSYMAHLLQRARHRSQQYVSLSWGVLAGLMRSLDIRDQRSARHAAAVARFARDMTQAVGMSEQEQELAHTAGLLHDIGTFALSDRVAEKGRTLTEEDWIAIQRHPELGADMLKDLGMYGPVAEIVLAHHERIDGRGYPHGLSAREIPEIAKIIAVAEVYDTLTASDTYRTRMSSFEALRELRRVADTQLDGRYVETLAQLLSGEGVEYRHADTADFDSELDMERRIREAGAGG
jgi:putative nucleotidyltransferase with HDIG domain